MKTNEASWEGLTKDEQKEKLIEQEKQMLEMFHERKAITREDYEKSMRKLEENPSI